MLKITDPILGSRPAFDPQEILSRMNGPDAKDRALPALSFVQRRMFALCHDLQVLRAVVAAVSVTVMHDFVRRKGATYRRLRNQPMLSDISGLHSRWMVRSIDVDIPTARFGELRCAMISGSFSRDPVARPRTEPMTCGSVSLDPEFSAADFARLHDGNTSRYAFLCSSRTGIRAEALSPSSVGLDLKRFAAVSADQVDAPSELCSLRDSLASTRTVFRLFGVRCLNAIDHATDRAGLLDGSRIAGHFADLLYRSVRCRAGDVPPSPGFSLPQFYQIGGGYAA